MTIETTTVTTITTTVTENLTTQTVTHESQDNPLYEESSVLRWLSRQKIKLCADTKTLAISKDMCGLLPDTVEFYVRRRGQRGFCLKYGVFDTLEDGRLQIVLDSRFFSLTPGRYEFRIMQDCSYCGSFEVELPRVCNFGDSKVTAMEGYTPLIHTGSIPNMTDIYDGIVDFSAKLCAMMDKTDTTLPLSDADIATLCAVTLCRSVELIISDGVKSETVQFDGCSGNVPQITRCIDGSTPHKFPVGSTVQFSWTSNNVTAVVEGCPVQ